ncbi:MAG: hypothetical protein V1807_03245 [Patescibacteria group bacterium]
MTSLKTTKIGLAALTIIFLLLYGYFSTLGKPLTQPVTPANQGFSINKITLGNIGGFHILKNIDYTDEPQYHRLIIATELNRSTTSPEAIAVPYLVVEGTTMAGESADNSAQKNQYQIKIVLNDTQAENIPLDRPLSIFEDTVASPEQSKLIQEVRVQEPTDATTEIYITLAKKSLFRSTADNAGTIVLDILK